jgi:type IV secretory pathway protease TraF
MAVSGTVRARTTPAVDPVRAAKVLRRVTVAIAAVLFTWFALQFGSAWVPANMDTVPAVPAGSWCIVDRWATRLRVGNDVFVDTPAGPMLSRVAALDADTVTVLHPNADSRWPDSRSFGPLPRRAVTSTVLVVFPPDGAQRGK